MTMLAVKNFFMPEKRVDSPRFSRMPEALMRSLRRRSLRVKRTKSLVLVNEKRKSDSFVNSQEWTAARGVTELRVGVLGSPDSGKSALVHRYLTGAYMQEESPEGGRFKKEVIIDGHSYLLLIRDEGGPPEMQFTAWVDAVIFVFSLENEISYNTVSNYFNKMSHYRNSAEIPIILVGTQDAISESSPRVVDDNRARKLSNELRRCSYYETCATYGLNVERVFQDACQKIVGTRLSASSQCLSGGSRPVTPQPLANSPSHNHSSFLYKDSLPRGHHTLSASSHHLHRGASSFDASSNSSGISSTHVVEIHSTNGSDTSSRWGNSLGSHGSSSGLVSIATENNNVKFTAPHCLDNLPKEAKDLPTPSSTPTTSRKSRRRSNLFTPSKKDDRLKNGELGSGRAIPLKQGYLYKKSSKALNKEWKKKYVTLCDDGRLTYHPSLHDYMEDVNGKEISLQYVTVKVPGQKPRGSKSIITTVPGYNGHTQSLDIHDSIGGLSLGYSNKEKTRSATDKALMSAFETMKEPASSRQSLASEAEVGSTNGADKDTPHVKKRHRRMKSSGVKNNGEEEESTSCEFTIVSLDGKRWRWEVCGGAGGAAGAERDAWVCAVEAQILASLQGRTSRLPAPTGANSTGDVRATYYIRRVHGNDKCCDCGAPDPDWASLNLGVLICIECSGIHRNLGSHISRVRSLDLDEWPLGHVSVMVSIGNSLANSIWEADLRGHIKPIATSTREEKERWIRLKYERRAFLSATEVPTSLEALRSASARGQMGALCRMLAAPAPRAPAHAERSLALRAAAAAGHLAAAQLLIWHNGNPNFPDADGHSCVFYARAAANHLSGIPVQYPRYLQLACPLHPAPPAPQPSSGTNSTSSSSSTKSSLKNPEPECNCIIFELLNAQSASNALVELLIGLQNNQYMNGYDGVNGLNTFGHATLGRPSLGPNLSLTNGKCGSIV